MFQWCWWCLECQIQFCYIRIKQGRDGSIMDCPVKSFYGVFESRELQRHSSVREKVTFGGNPIS